MTIDVLLIVLVPAVGAFLLASGVKEPRAARALGLVSVTLTLALACKLFADAMWASSPELVYPLPFGGAALSLGSDGSVAVLATAVALLHVGALATTKASLDARLTSACLLGEAGTMLGLCARSPMLLVLGWTLSLTPLLASGLTAGPARLQRRSALISIAFVVLATSLDSLGTGAGAWPAALPAASIAWVIAALARLGAPPLHAWAPALLHRAPVALAAPIVLSPLPVLVLVRLMERSAPGDWTGMLLVVLGTAGALYGAALAMIQHDLRRAIGYIQVSFASTLVASAGTATRAGALGAILGFAAGAVAISGLAFLASAISARTGTTDMRRLGGLHRSSPLGSAIFLLSGVAIVGFPGTIGFVSEELVMQGLIRAHPAAAVIVLIAAALDAVTLFRCYERTYLGAPSAHGRDPGEVEDLLPRERWIAMVWAALIVIGGFVPAPLMAIESAVGSSGGEDSARSSPASEATSQRASRVTGPHRAR